MARSLTRAERKKLTAMRMCNKFCVAIFGITLLAVPPQVAFAFDPEKVFKDERPSLGTLFRFFFTARKNGNEEDAIDALKYAAGHGSQAAQWKLGRMYQMGDGVPKDPRAAYEFFNGIVENYGNAEPGTPEWQFTSSAMVALGQYHLNGVPEAGIEVDPARARIMFTTAATYFGNPQAQFELAKMYLDGDNNGIETIQAARMLKSAANAQHIGAEALLGHLLFEGSHLRRDPVRGLSMMMHAQIRATAAEKVWIDKLVEEAFAVASEEERRMATEKAADYAEFVSQ